LQGLHPNSENLVPDDLDDYGERKKKKKKKKNRGQRTDRNSTNEDQSLAERRLRESEQNAGLIGQASLFPDPPLFDLIYESRIGRAPCGNGCRGNSSLFT
jgi:hypothetical protein